MRMMGMRVKMSEHVVVLVVSNYERLEQMQVCFYSYCMGTSWALHFEAFEGQVGTCIAWHGMPYWTL